MSALQTIRDKRTAKEPLTPIEEMAFDYFWINPANHTALAEKAAEQFERMWKRIAELEIAEAAQKGGE